MEMIIFNLVEFFNVKVSLFSDFFNPFVLFPRVLVNNLFLLFFISFIYIFFLPYFFI
jgi:hypothetical protein